MVILVEGLKTLAVKEDSHGITLLHSQGFIRARAEVCRGRVECPAFLNPENGIRENL